MRKVDVGQLFKLRCGICGGKARKLLRINSGVRYFLCETHAEKLDRAMEKVRANG